MFLLLIPKRLIFSKMLFKKEKTRTKQSNKFQKLRACVIHENNYVAYLVEKNSNIITSSKGFPKLKKRNREINKQINK